MIFDHLRDGDLPMEGDCPRDRDQYDDQQSIEGPCLGLDPVGASS